MARHVRIESWWWRLLVSAWRLQELWWWPRELLVMLRDLHLWQVWMAAHSTRMLGLGRLGEVAALCCLLLLLQEYCLFVGVESWWRALRSPTLRQLITRHRLLFLSLLIKRSTA
jgi:hypothetical protein